MNPVLAHTRSPRCEPRDGAASRRDPLAGLGDLCHADTRILMLYRKKLLNIDRTRQTIPQRMLKSR